VTTTSTTTGDAAVQVDQLVMRYGAVTAVEQVSFNAHAGRVTVILGPNGAGKTSTIEACEGFRSVTGGSVRVLGLDPQRDRKQLNKRIGVMLQDGGIYPTARVGEVVAHYCSLYGKGVVASEVIKKVGLEHRTKSTWKKLSGGEQQRLSLALALTARPEVAFLDEPTSGVDVNGRDMIRAVIKDLASTGCAVVLATHELDEAERCADDVVIFHQAKIVANGSLESIRSQSYEIRFRSGIAFDVAALAKYLDFPIQNLGEEYVIMGTADAAVIGKFSEWMSFHGADIRDLRAGAQRLEDIFRRLTTGDAQ
jgi:ABC-2 type transport system ATP-binding protein